MIRSTLAALAGLALFAGPGASQDSSPLNWAVVQGQLKDGGTYRPATRTWTRGPRRDAARPTSNAAGAWTSCSQEVRAYDNTCLWTGAAPNTIAFNATEACETIWDDGRLPGAASGVNGAGDDYLIDAVTFAHVTFAPVGTVDVTLEFFSELGGPCVGFASPNPPAPLATGSVVLNPASGVTLPGDPTGAGTPWFLTIDLSGGGEFCILAEGDGTAGSGADTFAWSFRHGNDTTVVPGAGGPVIAGEPLRASFGACTFDVPCGTDPLVGPCGTGASQFDGYWVNVDGDPAGPNGATNTSLICPSPPAGTGTGCFFFGGWPGNPWSGYFLALEGFNACTAICPPPFYCTGKTGSHGCIPFLTTDAGTASASATSPWFVRMNDAEDSNAGFLIYSFKKSNLDFHGGKLCVKAPFVRTPVAKTKQVPCVDPFAQCTTASCRQLRRNFNATVQGGSDPSLTAGQIVRAQMRQRDPTDPLGFGDNLSDGVQFTIAP